MGLGRVFGHSRGTYSPIGEPTFAGGAWVRGIVGVQGATVLVRLDEYPRGEAGRNLVPRPDYWTPEG
jgi:hypothetical protein